MRLAHYNRINWQQRHKHRVITKHHLIPRSRGGDNSIDNVIQLWSDKHEALNILFGSASTLEEQIARGVAVLQRLKQIKKI